MMGQAMQQGAGPTAGENSAPDVDSSATFSNLLQVLVSKILYLVFFFCIFFFISKMISCRVYSFHVKVVCVLSACKPLNEPNFRFTLLQLRTHFQLWMSTVPKRVQFDEK